MSGPNSSRQSPERYKEGLQLLTTLAFMSLAIACLISIPQLRLSYSLYDEGYFWYGVERVAKGDIPVRDFQAYDVGRYYIYAALTSFWGANSLLALRWAMIPAAASVVFGILLLVSISTGQRSILFLGAAGLSVMAWTAPYFKVHDFVACTLLLCGLSLLARQQTRFSYLAAGISVGAAAVLGRNHGIYGIAGTFIVLSLLCARTNQWRAVLRQSPFWLVGVLVGYAPILGMAVFVPGFAEAMWLSVQQMVEYGSTNLTLPIPWPWRILPAPNWPLAVRNVVIGCLFVFVSVFGIASILWVLRQTMRNRVVPCALVASAALALPYAHYAYSRADDVHLAFGILPLLTGILTIIGLQAKRLRTVLLTGFVIGNTWTAAPIHTGHWCFRNIKCVKTDISGDTFSVEPWTAQNVRLLRKLDASYASNSRSFLAVPYWPGAYALLDRASPMYEIYPLVPRSHQFEESELARIKASDPAFVVINDETLDQSTKYQFENTHPLIYDYVAQNFDLIEADADSRYKIFKARNP